MCLAFSRLCYMIASTKQLSGDDMKETRGKRIKTLIEKRLEPVRVNVVDESAKHVGHTGSQPEGETHYRVVVVSRAFETLRKIERHRLVNEVLADEFASGLHALSIQALTPQEDAAR